MREPTVVAHENQCGIEVFVVLLDVIGVILHRLSLVHVVEVEAGIICLDGLEERSESILETVPAQRSTMQTTGYVVRTTWGRFAVVEARLYHFHPFQRPPS